MIQNGSKAESENRSTVTKSRFQNSIKGESGTGAPSPSLKVSVESEGRQLIPGSGTMPTSPIFGESDEARSLYLAATTGRTLCSTTRWRVAVRNSESFFLDSVFGVRYGRPSHPVWSAKGCRYAQIEYFQCA